ncbi:hypothetical protein PEC311524_36020 [Pectobacterium carotovorum subsp. carotovorum]|nr:hypothetical protein PEC311524_36020 [Pectobacterium carotovorum subsp. carotovorum]
MSVLISGVLINPAGEPIPDAEITFTALTTSNAVLNGFSASTMTNDEGEYSIPLEHCVYSISIQNAGYNSIYGSVSINEKSTPTTINELLKLATMEQAVTPAIIVYFREIQADVAAKLVTMQTLSTKAAEAASAAVAARDEASQYAQNLSAAVAQAQQASAAAAASANAASNSANGALVAKNAAEVAAGNAKATLAGVMKKSANGADIENPEQFRANLGLKDAVLRGEFGVGGEAIFLPDNTDVLTLFKNGNNNSGLYKCLYPLNGPYDSGAFVFSWEKYSSIGEGNNFGVLTARSVFSSDTSEYINVLDSSTWGGWGKISSQPASGRIIVPPDTPIETFFSMDRGSGQYAYGGSWASAGLPNGFSDVFIDWSTYRYQGGATIGCIDAVGTFGNRRGMRIRKLLINGAWSDWSFDVSSNASNTSTINEWVSAPNSPFIGIGFYNGTYGNWPRPYGTVIQSYQRDAGGLSIMQEAVANANDFVRFFGRNIVVNGEGLATYGNPVEFLHTGNSVADANGVWRSASPVINIYADGSFTTTDEAAGVDVERLSQGVYKITGCQGMHPDAAWNGIDGGVSNPRCRNDKALLWNDYEVGEDGSITVYTFHRVHPDAMPFAQNRLTLDKEPFDPKKGHKLDETWPDQTPIDVPRGLFIQVRVNMPERIEPKFSVMHSNVYCNSVSLV